MQVPPITTLRWALQYNPTVTSGSSREQQSKRAREQYTRARLSWKEL